jgi:hypothetical protein
MRRAYLTFLVAAVGCSRAPDPGPAPVHIEAVEAGTDEVERVACAERPGCRLESRLALDRRADGSDLVAVVARLPRRARSHADHVVLAARVGSAPTSHECTPRETWLIATSPRRTERVQLLTTECAIDPAAGPLLIERLGANALRATVARRVENTDQPGPPTYSQAIEVDEFAFDPPRFLRTVRREGAPTGADEHGFFEATSQRWDWGVFQGLECWSGGAECGALLPAARIEDDGAFTGRDGWKTTGLGACSVTAQGRSASIRLLLVDSTLYVEVTDDAFVTRRPVVDAIELVSTSEDAKPGDLAWVERLTMDGTLTDHLGRQRHVDLAEAGASVRRFAWKDAWPPDDRIWWLSYVDTDDGRTAGERITPVPASNAHGQSLLRVSPAPSCAPRDGALHPRPVQAVALDVPIAP